jgi:hypothetical protein
MQSLILRHPKQEKKKQLHQIIDRVNYFRNMWFCRSTLIQDPLTSPTLSKVKFEWHLSHEQAFDKIKKVIVTEVLLCYPDFNKLVLFHLYTDASDHQLRAVIIKDKKPISFYL